MDIYEVVTENNTPTGDKQSADDIHHSGAWHRVANVFLFRNSDAGLEFLCHTKSERKGGKLDPALGGHVDAGETPSEAIVREVQEEIGLNINPDDLLYVNCFKIADIETERKFNYYYFVEVEDLKLNTLSLQATEIASVDWIPYAQIDAEMSKPNHTWVGKRDRLARIVSSYQKNRAHQPQEDCSFEIS